MLWNFILCAKEGPFQLCLVFEIKAWSWKATALPNVRLACEVLPWTDTSLHVQWRKKEFFLALTPGRFSAASGLRTGHRRTCLSRWQCSWWSSRPYRRQNPRPPFQGKPGIQNTLLMMISRSWDTEASKVYKIDKWSLIFYPFSFKTDRISFII